ncbi:hypothetical protein JCM4814A_94210 [Streptomyces phaeofaciens JCM 4814]|uniref:Uncharacterized protein n=1 Tax=Streptomyces phaeofaciens TaxID=68254 RepID=A0A918M0Z4_9ACTN|nr:hypothetical protein GCM10010226_90840 [Streptomyces phaeofaciens]
MRYGRGALRHGNREGLGNRVADGQQRCRDACWLRHPLHDGLRQDGLADLRHTYNRTSANQAWGRYRITATSALTNDWQVTTGGDVQAGQLTQTRQTQIQVPLLELQVLNQDRKLPGVLMMETDVHRACGFG